MFEVKGLSSDQLLAQLLELVHRGRKLEADLIEHLAEVDARRLYLREGCPSMFAYCVDVLRFAEAVAYKRIAAARAARRFPEILMALRSGGLHLTAVSMLAPQLAAENVAELLAAARHRTADEIRRMLADRQPKADVASLVKRVKQSATKAGAEKILLGNGSGLPASPSVPRVSPVVAPAPASRRPEPLGEERYLIRFTADGEFYDQIQQLKALMRHQVPDGDVGKILAKAAAVLLKQIRAQKFGECSAPRAARSVRTAQAESVVSAGCAETVVPIAPSRRIPAAIRRAVSKRDDERCTFVSATGRRCGSRDFLEFHHREPWARCGSHSIDGITLRCRAHNQYAAERDFGARHMKRFRTRDQRQTADLLSKPLPTCADSSRTSAIASELDLNPVGRG